jgi:hypothetical protein
MVTKAFGGAISLSRVISAVCELEENATPSSKIISDFSFRQICLARAKKAFLGVYSFL